MAPAVLRPDDPEIGMDCVTPLSLVIHSVLEQLRMIGPSPRLKENADGYRSGAADFHIKHATIILKMKRW